jgi:sulfane dehydrogenase subunit SoxC
MSKAITAPKNERSEVALRETAGEAIDRRAFLGRGVALAGAALSGAAGNAVAAATPSPAVPGAAPWQTIPGAPAGAYGQPSGFEKGVGRHIIRSYGDIAPGTGSVFTPLESLQGTITPSGLHFVRNHNGTPDIDPSKHRLMIHGMVKRPLMFSVAALARYPTITRTYFVECAGNSGRALNPTPLQVPVGVMHGLVGNSEWTGIPLAILLEEAGVDTSATWVLAEGADAASMSRSIPMEKMLDDAMLALYQNGERLRPDQGYPMRLLVPGYEGNMNVKWLRRLKVVNEPMQTKDETSKYSDLLPSGKALQFTFELGVKSIITSPAYGRKLDGHGFHEISGVAWSGAGRIRKVEVTTDAGATWREAALHGEQLPKSVVRFRMPWDWHGAPAILQSRATDEKGNVQLTRQAWIAQYHADMRYHNTSINSVEVAADGSIKNVYA